MVKKKQPFSELWGDVKKYIFVATYTVLLYLTVTNLDVVGKFLQKLLLLLSPFLYGVAFAYILNLLMRLFEEKVFTRVTPHWKRKRAVSIAATFLTLLLSLALLIWFIIPQLGASVTTLATNIPDYLVHFNAFLETANQKFGVSGDLADQILKNWTIIIQKMGTLVTEAAPHIVSATKQVTMGLVNVVMGLILSAYILNQKEHLLSIVKKLLYAFLPKEGADKLKEIGEMANRAFSGFISGQLIEALILGVLCFLGMTILRMPYALLVSVFIGVTSVIPIFGAYIGTIPSAFIILMADPPKAFWFVVFIIVLQQIEGNVIYPRVVGNSIGLGGLWVLFALLIGGSLFGLVGMVLGIPAFAVLYALVRKMTNRRLRERGMDL